jgi:hypothetical protein
MICKFFSKFNFFSVVFISCSDKNPQIEPIEQPKNDPLRKIISAINTKGSSGLLQEKTSEFNDLFTQILDFSFEEKGGNIEIEIEENDKKKFKYDELDSKKQDVLKTVFKHIETYYPEVIYILSIGGGLSFMNVDNQIKKEVDNWNSVAKGELQEQKNILENKQKSLTEDKKNLEEQMKNKNGELSNINKNNSNNISKEEQNEKKKKIDHLEKEIENLKYKLAELSRELEKVNDSLKVLKERENSVPEKKMNFFNSVKAKYIENVYEIIPIIYKILKEIIEPFDKKQKLDFVNSNETEVKKYLEDKSKDHIKIFYEENIVNPIIFGLKKLLNEDLSN